MQNNEFNTSSLEELAEKNIKLKERNDRLKKANKDLYIICREQQKENQTLQEEYKALQEKHKELTNDTRELIEDMEIKEKALSIFRIFFALVLFSLCCFVYFYAGSSFLLLFVYISIILQIVCFFTAKCYIDSDGLLPTPKTPLSKTLYWLITLTCIILIFSLFRFAPALS